MSSDRLGFLDVIRGVAIIGVFGFHSLNAAFGWEGVVAKVFERDPAIVWFLPFVYGWIGVPVFFVVSGFCIHGGHLARGGSTDFSGFLVRRAFRIWPPYLLALTVFYFVPPWGDAAGVSPGSAIAHVLNIHNYWPNYVFHINNSFWSIAVELQLYLIYPLLIALVGRLGWAPFLVIAALLEGMIRSGMSFCAVREAAGGGRCELTWLFNSPFAFWFSWSLGAWVAECWNQRCRSPLTSIPLWPVVILAVLVNLSVGFAPWGFPLWSLATAIIIAQLVGSPGWVGDKGGVVGRHLASLGKVSYSFYLIHQPLLVFAPLVAARIGASPLVSMVGCGLLYWLIYAVSCLGYRWLEIPSIELGKVVLRRLRKA